MTDAARLVNLVGNEGNEANASSSLLRWSARAPWLRRGALAACLARGPLRFHHCRSQQPEPQLDTDAKRDG